MPVIIISPSVDSYKNGVFRSDTSKQVQISYGAGVAQSVKRLATDWALRVSNSGGATYSAPVQTYPGAHAASSAIGIVFLSRGYSGRGVTLITHPIQRRG